MAPFFVEGTDTESFRLVRFFGQTAEPSESDYVSQKAYDQQPGAPFEELQNPGSQNEANQQVHQNS
jgi:hypothetical protein